MRRAGRRLIARSALVCSVAALAFPCATPASAQQSETAAPDGAPPDAPIIVTGRRASAVTDIAPIAELDADGVAATGATTVPELLQAIRGTTQAADGSEPIFLLNAQRVSGYQEIGSLPPEAIAKVEVLPEQAALKFGFPPTRRVVNFITKPHFRQVEMRGSAGTTTRLGSANQKANLALTRLEENGRLTLALELRRTDPLFLSDRDIIPDPDIPFDAIGNITAVAGGEIDPALSAAAGQRTTIAPVPEVPTLAAFAASANRPRLFDLGPYRTLLPRNEAIKAEAVIANRVGKTLAGSLSFSGERSRDRSLGGPATIRLLIPGANPYSPFGGPTILNRYLTETASLRESTTTTTLRGGMMLRGAIAGWRWDFTGALDQKQVDGRSENGIDPGPANAAVAAGADPFVPLPANFLAGRLTDRTRLRTRNIGAKTVITNTPVQLPAGRVSIIATAEADRSSAISSSRGPNPFDLRLARGRIEGGLAIDVPLTSRRENFLASVGDLSLNASMNLRHVGGFGSLRDTTFGLAWRPIGAVQLLATVRQSEVAPDMTQQSTPPGQVANVPVADFGTGRTELVTLLVGGNPDLAPERRVTRSLAMTVKPFTKRELRVAVTYETVTIRDQTGTVSAITPQTEAILPELVTRDSAGRLTSVTYRPINFFRERQRTLNITANINGKIGSPPPPGAKGASGQATYYGGVGPSIKFSDRLQIRPGAPVLDILRGDTIRGWGTPRIYGYTYGGLNLGGNGMTFSSWYQAPNRLRGATPAANLHFGSVLQFNLGGYVALGDLLKSERWARKLRLGMDISNLTDARQRVRDGNGRLPNRYQPDYLNPIGRTITLTLRKIF